jgi:hypothetical protein
LINFVAERKRLKNYFAASKVKIGKQDRLKNLLPNDSSIKTNTMKIYFGSILAAFVFALAGCSPAAETNSPVKDTSRLDDIANNQPQAADFVARVKLYYQSLEKKDWPTSYDMRTVEFKYDVSRDLYLKQMADSGETLTSYKVLGIRLYGDASGDNIAAEIIMEFHEGGMVSYNCARWIKRNGIWMCDEPGLSGLLTSTRIPDWITK